MSIGAIMLIMPPLCQIMSQLCQLCQLHKRDNHVSLFHDLEMNHYCNYINTIMSIMLIDLYYCNYCNYVTIM